MLKGVSWTVLPLVAGLFIIVQAVASTGIITDIGDVLAAHAISSPSYTAFIAGVGTGFVANAVNNLPAGLVAGNVAQMARASTTISGAILVGLDLGPNLSISGSLATILWLTALRRDGITGSAWTFFRLGLAVMPPTLIAALTVLIAAS